jgi:hypothetical protein
MMDGTRCKTQDARRKIQDGSQCTMCGGAVGWDGGEALLHLHLHLISDAKPSGGDWPADPRRQDRGKSDAARLPYCC